MHEYDRPLLEPLESRRMMAATAELVTDVEPAAGVSSIPTSTWSFSAGDVVYFVATRDGSRGLWRSDGTPEGTIFLKPMTTAQLVAETGGVVFVSATQSGGEQLLWQTDGTPEGTRLVKPGLRAHGAISTLHDDGALYFEAIVDGDARLWKTDGTEVGTVEVLNHPGQLMNIASHGGQLIFASANKLWASDGTPEGTSVIHAQPDEQFWRAYSMASTSRGLLFHVEAGREPSGLWITDGTATGTRHVAGGGLDFGVSSVLPLVGDTYYFIGTDRVHGLELWASDGTDVGTRMVKDIVPGAGSLRLNYHSVSAVPLAVDEGILLLELTTPTGERQVWRSDGTAEGTFALPIPSANWSVFASPFAVGEHVTYFMDNERIWTTDTTVAETTQLDWKPTTPPVPRMPHALGIVGDTLLFSADAAETGRELWRLTAPAPDGITFNGTAANDNWHLKRNGNQIEVRNNADGSGAAVSSHALGEALTLNGLDGDDTVTVDMSGGDINLSSHTITGANGTDKVRLTNGDGKTLTLGAVPTLNGEYLDLGTADLKLTGVQASAVEALLKSARDAAVRWSGPGIGTSSATADTGLSPVQQGADTLVKYSYNGDVNGDGRINADDYFRIDSGFLAPPADPTYADGDFNFDNAINADDYFLIDSAFLGQGQLLASSAAMTATPLLTTTTPTVSVEPERKAARKRPARPLFSDRPVSVLEASRRAGVARTR